MTITYTIQIDLDDDTINDAGEDITPSVLAMTWELGMRRPFDAAAGPSSAQITLRSDDGQFSPEINALLPGQRVIIRAHDGTGEHVLFVGVVSHVEPQTGDHGKRTALLHLHGLHRWLESSRVQIAPQRDVRADAVINAVLDATTVRRWPLADHCLIDVDGQNVIDEVFIFGQQNIGRSLQTGKSTFAFVGDQWPGGIPAAQAVAEAAASEQGRFFYTRTMQAVFYNRHETLMQTTVKATFDNDVADLHYSYGQDMVNQVGITLTPRIIGAENSPLWTLDRPQRVEPGIPREIIVRYRADDGDPMGAVDVLPLERDVDFQATLFDDGTGGDMTDFLFVNVEPLGTHAAKVELRNVSLFPIFLQTLTVRGTPLTTGDPLTVLAEDGESVHRYGPRSLDLNLAALTEIDEATAFAAYQLVRRKSPRGTVRELQTSTWQHADETLALTLFDRIRVVDDQTGHDAEYFVVAERHTVDLGGTRHRVWWLLEPAAETPFFRILFSQINGEHLIAPY